MSAQAGYQPSLKSGAKYLNYLAYLAEYVRQGDWKSLASSFRFVLHGNPEKETRIASSRLGKFMVRKGTIDFQFINFNYEAKIRNYLNKNINDFDVFIDVGACIGEYSIWLARLGKTCYAFEPVPANYSCVLKNAELNQVNGNFHPYNFGLGSKEEKVYFDIDLRETGSSHIVRKPKSKVANIDIKVLDTILNPTVIPNSKRVIMKLDVEGMEVDVLRGALQFISRIASLEIIYEDKHSGVDEVKELLEQAGSFHFIKIDEHNTLAIKNPAA